VEEDIKMFMRKRILVLVCLRLSEFVHQEEHNNSTKVVTEIRKYNREQSFTMHRKLKIGVFYAYLAPFFEFFLGFLSGTVAQARLDCKIRVCISCESDITKIMLCISS
jgi:hypothetical protein